jgi:putative two-component system response regulator
MHLGISVDFLILQNPLPSRIRKNGMAVVIQRDLSGDDIPIAARLMAVADVYDALISRRVYKEGMPHEKAVQIMIEGRASHFDPDMLDAFLDIQEEFRGIAQRFIDSDADLKKKKDYLTQAISA